MTQDVDALAVAERVLGILDEGSFSATYKYALFTGLLDVCLQNTTRTGLPPTIVTTRQLAERVVELYWPQAAPYQGRGTLRQGGVRRDNQAEIVRRIANVRTTWSASTTDTPFRVRLRQPRVFGSLIDFVEWKLIEMPIPRLQILGRREDRFLYEYNWTQGIRQSEVSAYQRGRTSPFDNRLLLKPGIAAHLVRLNGVLRPVFHHCWTLMVANLNRLPEAELERFMFGADRVSLDAVRRPLMELQGTRCFYCEGRIEKQGDVDHFVPWSRYADDGLDNLVVAHARCNNSKRDFLAALEHVERWRARSRMHGADLDAIAAAVHWRRDEGRTASVARGIYFRLPKSAQLWSGPGRFIDCDPSRLGAALH